jgi:hypothetical protein
MTTPSNFSILLLPTTALTLLHEPALDHGVDAFVGRRPASRASLIKLTASRTAGRLLRCGISPSACRDKARSLCAMVLNSYSSSKTNIHAHKHRFTYMGKL